MNTREMLRREFLTAAVSSLALSATRDAGSTNAVVFPHGRPIVSFATSASGRWLVTGAECSDSHADDALEGVTCWSLDALAPLWTTRLEGGVGLADQLRGGVRFSPNDALVAANCHTNELAVLDAKTGKRVRGWANSQADGAVAWCWSRDPGNPGALAVLAEGALLISPARGPDRPSGLEPLRPIAFDAQGITQLATDRLQRGAQRLPLGARAGHALCSAVSDTTIAVGTQSGELVLVDRASFKVRARHPLACEALSLTARGDVVAILRSRRDAALVRDGKVEPITHPLAAHDWMAFADGRAVAVSPSGRRVVTVDPSGAIDELGGPRRAEVPGAVAVAWPAEDRIVAIGPRVVALLDSRAGVLAVSRLR